MSAANEDSTGVSGVWPGNGVGGHKCNHQGANGPFLGRSLRHREGVSSNCYLPAMDRCLGFSVRLSISGQGSLVIAILFPFQPSFANSKNNLFTFCPCPAPQESCSYTALHAQWSHLSTGKQDSWHSYEWSHYLAGNALFPPPPCHSIAVGLGQPRVEKSLVWYCMISLMCNFKTIQMNIHAKQKQTQV